MLNWFKQKDLSSLLNEKKVLKIKGVNFVIKKIDALAFLDGSKVMMQYYDVYKVGKSEKQDVQIAEKKIREHFSEVIVSGCVSPKLSHKEEEGSICVNELFKDMDIVNKLYEEIIGFTYGKKKLNI